MKRALGTAAGLALLAVLMVLVVWVTGDQPARVARLQMPLASQTATPASPLPTPSVEATVTLEPTPIAAIEGEVRIVLTNTMQIHIGRWLPDDQRLVVAAEHVEANWLYEDILVLNPATGEQEIFGRRAIEPRDPVPEWLPDIQKMAFIGHTGPCPNLSCPLPNLWITGAGTVELTTPVVEKAIEVTSQGHQVLVLQDGQTSPVLVDALSGEQTRLPVDLIAYGYDPASRWMQMLWHPTLPLVAILDEHVLLLLHLDSFQVEVVDLGIGPLGLPRWAFEGQWSPDGQYLALAVTEGEGIGPRFYMHLAYLHLPSHQVSLVDLGHQYVSSLAWSPDSRTIAVLASLHMDEHGFMHDGLFLVDTQGAPVRQLLAGTELSGGGEGGLAWSPDGSTFAVQCPEYLPTDPFFGETRLCIAAANGIPF